MEVAGRAVDLGEFLKGNQRQEKTSEVARTCLFVFTLTLSSHTRLVFTTVSPTHLRPQHNLGRQKIIRRLTFLAGKEKILCNL